MKSIYDLKLNEETIVDNFTQVKRVPGGWIYSSFFVGETQFNGSSVFVPYNIEFHAKNI